MMLAEHTLIGLNPSRIAAPDLSRAWDFSVQEISVQKQTIKGLTTAADVGHRGNRLVIGSGMYEVGIAGALWRSSCWVVPSAYLPLFKSPSASTYANCSRDHAGCSGLITEQDIASNCVRFQPK